jgi:hypothetical protein
MALVRSMMADWKRLKDMRTKKGIRLHQLSAVGRAKEEEEEKEENDKCCCCW